MDKIKVLYISQATGGVQRHIISVLEKIDKGRFEVSAVCPPADLIKGVSYDKESFPAALSRTGASVHLVNMRREISPLSDLAAFFGIYSIIKKGGFDVVHTHSSKAGFIGRIAARLAGVPFIVHTPHSFAFDRPASEIFQRLFYGALERFAALFCDRIIAVCEDEKKLAIRYLGVPPDKVKVVSNAVDLSLYDAAPDRAVKRQEFGIGRGERVIAFVGRLAAQKAPFDLIRALEMAAPRGASNFVCLMLGDGPLLKKAKKYVRGKSCAKFIKVLGWRNDIKEIIAACDIFVLPSLWEVLPNFSLLDAMAFGRPLVITDTLGAKDMVVDGYNGFIVEKSNPRMLCEALLKAIKLDDEKLSAFGRHSREMLERRPQLKDAAREIEKIYETVVK